MRRLEEIPVISLADSETDTFSTGPDVEDHHFEEEGFVEFRQQRDAESEPENDGMSVVSGDDAVVTHPDPPLEILLQDTTPPIREAIRRLDGCDVEQIFARRGCVMKSVPFFLKGPFRSALRIALLEATADEHVRRTRGWKLFLLLPRMLLSRRPRGGSVSREKLQKRFELFTAGQWEELIGASQEMANEASDASTEKEAFK